MTIIYTSPMYQDQAKRAIKSDSQAQAYGIAGNVLRRILGFASDIGQQENQDEYQKRLMGPYTTAMMPDATPDQQMAGLKSMREMSQENDPSILQRFGFGSTPKGVPPAMAMQASADIFKAMPRQKYTDPLERERIQTEMDYKRSLAGESDARTKKTVDEINRKIGSSATLQSAMDKLDELDNPLYEKTLLGNPPAKIAMGLGLTDVESPEFKTLTDAIKMQQDHMKESLLASEKLKALTNLQAVDDPEQAVAVLDSQRHELEQSGRGYLADDVEGSMLKWIELKYAGEKNKQLRQEGFTKKVDREHIEYDKEKRFQSSLTGKIAAADISGQEMVHMQEQMPGEANKKQLDAAIEQVRASRLPAKRDFEAMLAESKNQEAQIVMREWKARRAVAKGTAALTPAEEQMARDYGIANRMMNADSRAAAIQIWTEANQGRPLPANLRNTDDETYQEALMKWLSTLDPEATSSEEGSFNGIDTRTGQPAR